MCQIKITLMTKIVICLCLKSLWYQHSMCSTGLGSHYIYFFNVFSSMDWVVTILEREDKEVWDYKLHLVNVNVLFIFMCVLGFSLWFSFFLSVFIFLALRRKLQKWLSGMTWFSEHPDLHRCLNRDDYYSYWWFLNTTESCSRCTMCFIW